MLLRFFFVSKRSKGALQKDEMDENNLAGRDLPFGNVKNRLELELTLNGEVLDSEMFLPIVGQALVEGTVFLWSDVGWVASPEWFRLIELLVGDLLFLDLLLFLVLLLLLIFDFLNLRLF